MIERTLISEATLIELSLLYRQKGKTQSFDAASSQSTSSLYLSWFFSGSQKESQILFSSCFSETSVVYSRPDCIQLPTMGLSLCFFWFPAMRILPPSAILTVTTYRAFCDWRMNVFYAKHTFYLKWYSSRLSIWLFVVISVFKADGDNYSVFYLLYPRREFFYVVKSYGAYNFIDALITIIYTNIKSSNYLTLLAFQLKVRLCLYVSVFNTYIHSPFFSIARYILETSYIKCY